MADYTPVYTPGRVLSLTASSAVQGGDLLVVSGNGTVATAAPPAAGAKVPVVVGVAGQDRKAQERVTVYARGIVHESVAYASVTAGDLLTVPPDGAQAGAQVATIPDAVTPTALDVNNSRAIVGVAFINAAYPAKVRWMEF